MVNTVTLTGSSVTVIPVTALRAGMTYVHPNGHRSIVADVEYSPYMGKRFVAFEDAANVVLMSSDSVQVVAS